MRLQADGITDLLKAANSGDGKAAGELVRLVYDDLKKAARGQLAHERPDHTLQPTAIVNEAFLRLFRAAGKGSDDWLPRTPDVLSRSHFLCVAAKQMRQVLIDHARQKKTRKRDFGFKISLEDVNQGELGVGHISDFEELDEQLNVLAAKDADVAKVVEMKFFGGMTDEEVAMAMGTNLTKVRRDWEFARSWLRVRLTHHK